jgi:hypothetical protein
LRIPSARGLFRCHDGTNAGNPDAWNIGTTSGLLRLTNEVQKQALIIGFINAFCVITLTAAVAVTLAWLMRNRAMEQ